MIKQKQETSKKFWIRPDKNHEEGRDEVAVDDKDKKPDVQNLIFQKYICMAIYIYWKEHGLT